MLKKLRLRQMNRMNQEYLDKLGTDGYEDFKQFMVSKGIPASTLEMTVKRVWDKLSFLQKYEE